MRLDGDRYTVIGVMAGTFENVLAPSAEAWAPLQYDSGNFVSTQTREWGHHLRLIGRVQGPVTQAQVNSDLRLIASTPGSEFPRPRWASLQHVPFSGTHPSWIFEDNRSDS